jgi:hypothetical protein
VIAVMFLERGSEDLLNFLPAFLNGVPGRAHRLRALGNAVVPQLPRLIGAAILAHMGDGFG